MSTAYEDLPGSDQAGAFSTLDAYSRLRPVIGYWSALLGGLVLALLAFSFLKQGLYAGIAQHVSPTSLTVATCLMALAGSWLAPQMLSPAALIFYRTSSLLVGAYIAVGHVPLPDDADATIANWFAYTPWLAAVAALLSIWRPTLAFLPFATLIIHKNLTAQVWGISITSTDWAPVVESTSFLLLSSVFVIALRSFVTRLSGLKCEAIEAGRLRLADALVVVAIGIHFANYFWSGMAKVMLDGGPFIWLLENRTDILVDVAKEGGFFTIAYGLPFSKLVSVTAMKFVLPLNFLTLGIQLACVAVFWRRTWIIVITLLYDVQHITIFLLTGIFFWKWIVFNLALVAAASRIEREKIPLPVGALGLSMCVMGGHLFFVAKLGWYDTPSFNHLQVLAVTDDGREIPVPTNFWGPLSVPMAQQRSAYDWANTFPTKSWGATFSHEQMQAAMGCQLPVTGPGTPGRNYLMGMIPKWHTLMLRKADAGGRVNYDVYPHHIWSDPRRFTQFAALDLRRVTAYHLILDAKCVDTNKNSDPLVVSRMEALLPLSGVTSITGFNPRPGKPGTNEQALAERWGPPRGDGESTK